MKREDAPGLFSDMPDDVFDQCLESILANASWGPEEQWQFAGESHQKLGGESLLSFSLLRWKRGDVLLTEEVLCEYSLADVRMLIDDHVNDIETPMRTRVQDSKGRFLWQREFLSRENRVCAPVVLIHVGDKLRIADGSHRIAAVHSLGLSKTFAVDAWIGERPGK